VKSALFEEFAVIGRALSSAKRLELLDLLCQRKRTVESLARLTGMGVTNTSQHLQTLKAARLVQVEKEGTRSYYRVADPTTVLRLYDLQRLGHARLAEADRLVRDYFEGRDRLEPVGCADLLARVRRKDVVVIDVRPVEEYRTGHIRGALSLPLDELARRLAEIPRGAEVVAYCRGPFCVLAPQALQILEEAGISARRLDGGFPEWQVAGYPVEVSA
jgi:rhodanese-related sulfurtransferase